MSAAPQPTQQPSPQIDSPTTAQVATQRIALWDLPTRLFHWGLVAAVATAFVSGQLGGNLITLHGKAGLVVVGLLVFRVVWGFVGNVYARFLHFAPTPGRLRAYLKGQWQGHGHNPLGALSVFVLLGLLALQVGTGLFTNDDIAFTGPLFSLIDEDLAQRITGLHKQLSWVLLGFLALHLAAIVFHVRIKKHNLVKPMITGWKDVASDVSASGTPGTTGVAPVARQSLRLVALVAALVLAGAATYGAAGGWLPAPPPAPVAAPAPF
jgi:cytochrome b